MGAAVARVMAALYASLEVKCRLYKNPALGALFMMNNCQYMAVTGEVLSCHLYDCISGSS